MGADERYPGLPPSVSGTLPSFQILIYSSPESVKPTLVEACAEEFTALVIISIPHEAELFWAREKLYIYAYNICRCT